MGQTAETVQIWNDQLAAAIGGFVKYTCGEFILFATEYFKRGSDNFTTRSLHKMAIEAMEQDATKTAADILAYDYSTGWH